MNTSASYKFVPITPVDERGRQDCLPDWTDPSVQEEAAKCGADVRATLRKYGLDDSEKQDLAMEPDYPRDANFSVPNNTEILKRKLNELEVSDPKTVDPYHCFLEDVDAIVQANIARPIPLDKIQAFTPGEIYDLALVVSSGGNQTAVTELASIMQRSKIGNSTKGTRVAALILGHVFDWSHADTMNSLPESRDIFRDGIIPAGTILGPEGYSVRLARDVSITWIIKEQSPKFVLINPREEGVSAQGSGIIPTGSDNTLPESTFDVSQTNEAIYFFLSDLRVHHPEFFEEMRPS